MHVHDMTAGNLQMTGQADGVTDRGDRLFATKPHPVKMVENRLGDPFPEFADLPFRRVGQWLVLELFFGGFEQGV
jgi:hypothetical protein